MPAPPLDCPKQARCPGCPLGAEPYEAGLALKGAGLSQALALYADLTPELLEPRAASPTLHYRLRAKLVSHGQALGLFERGSHRVIDVDGCRVLSPTLLATATALRRLLPLPLHGADLRETSEGVLVTLLTEQARARPSLEIAARALIDGGAALSVAVSVRQSGEVRLLSGDPEVVAGPNDARHALSPGSPYAYATHGGFVQAHAGQASYVYAEIARGLRARLGASDAPRVLELFAGNGSLALALARDGAHVTAVEAYAPAIELAERAAREQGLELRAVAADATRFTRDRLREVDAVVVNPPRRGLDAELRRAIARAQPRTLVYVSCNPHTLARDAGHLARLGLKLERAEPLDMIPWSDALEALSWFSPSGPPTPRILFESAELLAVEKSPHEAVFGANGAEPSLLERVQKLMTGGVVTPLSRWGKSVSGVCWFAKRAPDAARPKSSDTEHELTLLVRGNLRKQGTVTRSMDGRKAPGARYKKQRDVGRHSLASVVTQDADEQGTLRDLVSIRHPVLGDADHGDPATNDFALHRHGLDRAFVHCARSRLQVPGGGAVEALSELAPDLAQVLASLGSD